MPRILILAVVVVLALILLFSPALRMLFPASFRTGQNPAGTPEVIILELPPTATLPPVEATLAAVQVEATSVAQLATQSALDQMTIATTEALQTEVATLKASIAPLSASPMASPVS